MMLRLKQELDDGCEGLSLSMKGTLRTAFIHTCRCLNRNWNDVGVELVAKFVNDNGKEFCLQYTADKAEEWIERHNWYKRVIAQEGSIKAQVLMDAVNWAFDLKGIEYRKIKPRRGDTTFVDRTEPIAFTEIVSLFGALVDRYGQTFLNDEFYPYVLERANTIKNDVVRSSFLDGLKEFRERLEKDPVMNERMNRLKLQNEKIAQFLADKKIPEPQGTRKPQSAGPAATGIATTEEKRDGN
jgi:hypothetical protein